MFGKNTYGSLLQQDSRGPTHSGLNAGSEILLTHHHDLLSGHYHPVPDPALLYSNQELGHGLNAVTEPSSAPRTTAKKDRHSKINTAQGPRDRRVRLSIGVARKFFDLQEMLGFDKPSKTLDWLLTKSKSAIKHMVQTKGSTTTKSVLSECEENNHNDSSNFRTKDKSVRKNSSKKKIRAKVDAQHQEALSLAKESRVKARARARERTMEKMCIKQQQEQQQQQHRINGTSGYNLIPIQYMNNQDYHQEDLMIQESIVSKRRVIKHTSDNNNPSIFGFQTSYGGMPSSSFSNAAADNWDISNYATQSSICAILDQHKFNHS